MKCVMCDRATSNLCVIHPDVDSFDIDRGLKSHHVIGEKEWFGAKEDTVSVAICADCVGKVLHHILEDHPKGALRDFTSPDHSEEDAYKKIEALHHWLLSDREAEDIAGLVKELTGRTMKVRVYLE